MPRQFFPISVTLKDTRDRFVCISFIITKCDHIFIESPVFEHPFSRFISLSMLNWYSQDHTFDFPGFSI